MSEIEVTANTQPQREGQRYCNGLAASKSTAVQLRAPSEPCRAQSAGNSDNFDDPIEI